MGSMQNPSSFGGTQTAEQNGQYMPSYDPNNHYNTFSDDLPSGGFGSNMDYFDTQSNNQSSMFAFDNLNDFSFGGGGFATPNGTINYTTSPQDVYGGSDSPSFAMRQTVEPNALDPFSLQDSQLSKANMAKMNHNSSAMRYGQPTPDASVTPPNQQSPAQESKEKRFKKKRAEEEDSKDSINWDEDNEEEDQEEKEEVMAVAPPKRKRGRKSKKDSQTAEEKREGREKFLERNRFAAAKCRENKKKWQSNLQDQNTILDRENGRLKLDVAQLRHEVDQLRGYLLSHMNCKDDRIRASLLASGDTLSSAHGVPPPSINRDAVAPNMSLRGTEFQFGNGISRRNSAPSTPLPVMAPTSHRRNNSISTPGSMRPIVNEPMSRDDSSRDLFDVMDSMGGYFDFQRADNLPSPSPADHLN